jgi:hypothetical protein
MGCLWFLAYLNVQKLMKHGSGVMTQKLSIVITVEISFLATRKACQVQRKISDTDCLPDYEGVMYHAYAPQG